MDKQPIGYKPGKGNPLDKLPPKNKKFNNIQSNLDTGYTIKNVEVISDKVVASRKNEIFKRIKAETVAKLIQKQTNQESIYNLGKDEDDNISQTFSGIDLNKNDFDRQSTLSMNSKLTQNTNVTTSLTAVTYATDKLGLGEQSEFLLLDLREQEDFELFHINEALLFPAPKISQDKIIPELLQFKNKQDKIIIIYHLDDKNGMIPAKVLTDKGFENIYLLSGGIEGFMQKFPDLIEGKKIPVIQSSQSKSKVLLKRTHNENGGDKSVKINLANKDDYEKESIKNEDLKSLNNQSIKSVDTAKKSVKSNLNSNYKTPKSTYNASIGSGLKK